MADVWIVICNGEVSSEGYKTIYGALNFVRGRNNNPLPDAPQDIPLIWHDELSNEYRLKCLTIKE